MPYARKDTIIWQEGLHYHIYNRGAHRVTIFREATNYMFTISKIKQYSQAKRISVIAYCLMPNHYHFLLRQDSSIPAGELPQFVFNSYSKAYDKMYAHSGTLFEGRYWAKVIKSNEHLLHLCRYIHGNPVKDGLVPEPSDWPYTNYLEWIQERPGWLVDRTFIKEHFSHPEEYKQFLMEYLISRRLPEDVMKYVDEIEKKK